MFEDDATVLVECPYTGESSEVTARVAGETMTWHCPKCDFTHSVTIDYGDDAGWFDTNGIGRTDCE
jgi:hypothetical protein